MEKAKTLKEIARKYGAEEEEEGNLRVRVQILEDGEVIEEEEGNGLTGVLIDDCDCGECDGERYGFILGGLVSSQDGVMAKYAFNKEIDRFIDVGQGNPFQELANMFGDADIPDMPF